MTVISRIMRGPEKYPPLYRTVGIGLPQLLQQLWNTGWRDGRFFSLTLFSVPLAGAYFGYSAYKDENTLKNSPNPMWARLWITDKEWREKHHFKTDK